MRIKKTFQGNFPENTVVNTQSNSQINAYSCNYVNGKLTSFVDLTSNQTIGGVKTFSSVPVCATQPTSNDELANKAYVDAQAGGGFDYTSITGYSQSTANQFLTHDTNGNLMWATIPVAAQSTIGGVKAYVDGNGDLQISTQ